MEGEDQCDVRFRHITEITILTVQLIVEFAKRLPGFDKLLREDQIALLKVFIFFLSTIFLALQTKLLIRPYMYIV